ncbi:MAG: NOL1/NOP2/sun family putative RNA methylase, partial [bacterium JZ-2024 1]
MIGFRVPQTSTSNKENLISFPESFVERYRKWLGDELPDFLAACARPLRKSFQTNTLKVSKETLLNRAQKLGWKLNEIPWSPGGYWVDREDRERPLGHSLEHFGGWIYIQEASSMAPVEALEPFQGMTMLDLSAAPGGKTILSAIKVNDRALIIANDVSISRLKSMVFNIERIGLTSAVVVQENGTRYGTLFPNTFDRVLVDAPCSAEGTIRKDPSALDWWSLDWIKRVSRTQKALLLAGYHALKPDGILIYSTCTLTPEENEQVIDSLLEKHPEAEVEEIRLRGLTSRPGIQIHSDCPPWLKNIVRIYPHLSDTEGFVLARVRKPRETRTRKAEQEWYRPRERVLGSEERRKILRFWQERYGWSPELFDDLTFAMVGRSLWVWNQKASSYFRHLKVNRAGLRMVR